MSCLAEGAILMSTFLPFTESLTFSLALSWIAESARHADIFSTDFLFCGSSIDL